MKVELTQSALRDLEEIWEWNARERGLDHANNYLASLVELIFDLDKNHADGSSISPHNPILYIRLRSSGRRKRGHCHLAVYRVHTTRVRVLRIFHSAQDWPNRLSEDT